MCERVRVIVCVSKNKVGCVWGKGALREQAGGRGIVMGTDGKLVGNVAPGEGEGAGE